MGVTEIMKLMSIRIPFISTIMRYFQIYWKYTGIRIFILIFMTVFTGFTEGFGISLFMPVLAKTQIMADSADKVSTFFQKLFQFLAEKDHPR